MVPSSTHRLPLTRISLYYLFTYLTLTGLGLMCFPVATLRLLPSNATNGHDMARFAGVLMLAVGLVLRPLRRNRYRLRDCLEDGLEMLSADMRTRTPPARRDARYGSGSRA